MMSGQCPRYQRHEPRFIDVKRLDMPAKLPFARKACVLRRQRSQVRILSGAPNNHLTNSHTISNTLICKHFV